MGCKVKNSETSPSPPDGDDEDDDDGDVFGGYGRNDPALEGDEDDNIVATTVLEPRSSPMEEKASLPTEERDLRALKSLWNPEPDDALESLELVTLGVVRNPNKPTLSRWDLNGGSPDEPLFETPLDVP